tara:strand:+ start:183 stop:764 length:582 start_codon:yes stop_codon:yes gene_type:complete
MPFWTDTDTINNPKRSFRFRVQFSNSGAFAEAENLKTTDFYWAKTAQKPSFTVGAAEHSYLNHTFKFPGRITWSDVQITMVDPGGDEGVAYALAKLLSDSGYSVPQDSNDLTTISKSKSVSGMGGSTAIKIIQLDDNGNAIEEWTLFNAFIVEANFGQLDYSSEELTEYSITLKYDWAQLGNVEYRALSPAFS